MSFVAIPWLREVGCVLLAGGGVAAALGAYHSPNLRARLGAYAARVDEDLRYVQALVTGRALCTAQLCALLITALAWLATQGVWPLAFGACVAVAPGVVLRRARQRRTTAIEQQLDAFVLALANALRANPALSGALAAAREVTPSPLADEIELALRHRELGAGLDRALAEIGARTRSPVVSAALAILRVARESGGDLSRTLETMASGLREMARLEGVVRTKTAEGRAQVAVITVAPLLLVGMLQRLDPDLLRPLWVTPAGHGLVAAALLLWGAAIVLARKIVAVDI
jgi:tight adherence protein B